MSDDKDVQKFLQLILKRLEELKDTKDNLVTKKDLSGVQSDLGEVKKDLSIVQSDLGEVKKDLTIVQSDLGEVKKDLTIVQSDLGEVKKDLSYVQSDLGEVKKEFNEINKNVFCDEYSVRNRVFVLEKDVKAGKWILGLLFVGIIGSIIELIFDFL